MVPEPSHPEKVYSILMVWLSGAVANVRRMKVREQRRLEHALVVRVFAAPQGDVSLEPDIELLKAAVVYADRVVLTSPVAAMAAAVSVLTGEDETARLQVALEMARAIDPEGAENLSALIGTRDHLQRLPRDQRRAQRDLLAGLTRTLRDIQGDLAKTAAELLDGAGARPLAEAVQAGFVEIDPLVLADGDDFTDRFMGTLIETLLDPHSFAVMDEQTTGLVRAMIEEGAARQSPRAAAHSKEAHLNTELLHSLPAFSRADLEEVLEIREDLTPHLVRYRATVGEMSTDLTSAAHDIEFTAEARELLRRRVEPALLEIAEGFNESRRARRVIGEVTTSKEGIGSLGITPTVLMTLAHLDVTGLTAALASVGSTVPLVATALNAAKNAGRERRQLRKHGLFLAYDAQRRLSAD